MSDWLPYLFGGVGLVLLVAAGAVWHQSRKIRACVADLLALPEDLHPMEWPVRAKPILQRAGVRVLQWDGHWFGDGVSGRWGPPHKLGKGSRRLEAGPDCTINVRWLGTGRADEAGSRALTVLDVFLQTWLLRMRGKTQAVAVAMAQRAHVHLFWQHDMRNMAQWVGMLADEFGGAADHDLLRLAQRLKRQAPLAQQRARKLLAYTVNPPPPPQPQPQPQNPAAVQAPKGANRHAPKAVGQPPQVSVLGGLASGFRQSSFGERVDPLAVLEEAAVLAGLTTKVMRDDDQKAPGTTVPLISASSALALESALDNVFSNIARDEAVRAAGQPMACTWLLLNDHLRLRLRTPHLGAPWPERPFEPMRSATGSGIGLYQARRTLREARGDLTATATDQGVLFEVTLSPAT